MVRIVRGIFRRQIGDVAAAVANLADYILQSSAQGWIAIDRIVMWLQRSLIYRLIIHRLIASHEINNVVYVLLCSRQAGYPDE